MTYRERPEPHLAPDPLARFQDLYAALAPDPGLFTDTAPLRLAALALITAAGDPHALARAALARDEALRRRLGLFSSTGAALRQVLAAQLVKYDDDPDAFLDEVERVQGLFRERGLRRGGPYEVLAVLILRRGRAGAPIDEADVARLAALYEAMKSYHGWLTGPEDLPACAMLVRAAGEPSAIAAGIEAIYQALHTRAALATGDALQSAAGTLYLAGADPDDLAARFAALAHGFRGAGVKVGRPEYDELAALCFLALPPERVVDAVMAIYERLGPRKWLTGREHFNFASNLAFISLLSASDARGQLADVKLLIDMQMIVTAQQAALAATTAAAAAG